MKLRILSLLPAATEIVYLLGLQDLLVGVSHECDFPLGAKNNLKVTSSPISNNLSSLEINTEVARLKHKGSGVFHVDEKLLAELSPDLILTQELCDVCAISWTEVRRAAKILDLDSKIVSLEPESISDILEDIVLVGKLAHKEKSAEKAVRVLKERIRKVESKLRDISQSEKKKVLIIEWLEPVMNVGHWVPEMIEKAGGKVVKMNIGHKSYPINLEQVVESDPDVIIFAPCGFDISRTLSGKYLIDDLVKKIGNDKIKYFLMDGNAYLTRPGPRIVDGIEILVEILHPEIFPRKYTKSDWQEL